MDEETSLIYVAGELKRSHLTAAVFLCDPSQIYKVMNKVRQLACIAFIKKMKCHNYYQRGNKIFDPLNGGALNNRAERVKANCYWKGYIKVSSVITVSCGGQLQI